MFYSCLKGRTCKLSLVDWIPLQVCNLSLFHKGLHHTDKTAEVIWCWQRQDKSSPSILWNAIASQVNSAKAAVRLPTGVEPACVQADPQTCSCQQRKVQKLWHVSILISHLSSCFQEKLSQAHSFTLFYYCFCIIGQFIICLHTGLYSHKGVKLS